MKELKALLKKIDSLQQEIDRARPIKPELEKRIMDKFRLDWNFHSNNIEGNQLTFGETKTFLLHGITANGKPLKDHLDIKGHNEALLMFDEIVKKEMPITENFIRQLHEIILHEPYYKTVKTPDGKEALKKIEIGKYKSLPNHVETVTGEMFYFASPEETPAKMHDLIEWYKKTNTDKDIHPLITASLFHYKFIRIHPFDDGNGRLARILMNIILMQNGFPPVIIKTEKKDEYYRALQQADGGDEQYFTLYIGEQLERSMDIYIRGMNGENIEEDNDVDKEIMLLKKELEGEEEKIKIHNETKKIIFQQSILPLYKSVLTKLSKFDELFFETKKQIFLDNKFKNFYGIKDIHDFISFPEDKRYSTVMGIKQPKRNSTSIFILWTDFAKIKELNFKCSIQLHIDLNKFNSYSIYTEPNIFNEVINISYTNPILTNEQIKSITNALARYVLNTIKEQTQKGKSQI